MAKAIAGNEGRAKVKFRVIEFELEGGNAAVENSIRQLTNTIAVRSGGPNSTKDALTRGPAILGTGEDETEEPDVEGESASEDTQATSAPVKPRPSRKVSAPEPIEVDLASGDKPFKQFCEERGINAGSTDTKKYLVAAVWMKEYRQIAAIEAGHIYSIFKMMKRNLPADVGGPLRSMKKQKWFTNSERGKFAINHLGENAVNGLGD